MKKVLIIFLAIVFSLCLVFVCQNCFHFYGECVDSVEEPKTLRVAIFYTPQCIDTVEYRCHRYFLDSYRGSNNLCIVVESYEKCKKCGKFVVETNIRCVLETTAPFKVIEFK